MKVWFGLLLCKIGLHKEGHVVFYYGDWYECLRCGKDIDAKDIRIH